MPPEKLVRDKLDARIPAPELRIERDPARLGRLLAAKLEEELGELRASAFRDVGEFADVIEVLYAIAKRAGLSPADIEAARVAKAGERGAFERGLVWLGQGASPASAAQASGAQASTAQASTGLSPSGRSAGANGRSVPNARSLGIAVPGEGEVHVYADGACSGNPGPGGWGAVVVRADGSIDDLGGAERSTTNNRMELAGATEGLLAAVKSQPKRIVLHLDSTYVKDGITGWVHGWKKRGWVTASGSPVKNREMWEALDAAVTAAKASGIEIRFQWVRGHSSHPGNERADTVARGQITALRRA